MTGLEKAAERFRKLAEQKSGESLKAINDFYELYLGKFQEIVDENEALLKKVAEYEKKAEEANREAGEARASRA